MRFGISAMQFVGLVPAEATAEGVIAHVAAFDHAAHVAALADRGFDLVELAGDFTLFFPGAFAPPAIANLAALQTERKLGFTCHLPLWSVEPSSPLTPVRQGSVEAVVATIRATEQLAPATYVLHATNALAAEFYRRRLPDPIGATVLGLFLDNARQSIETILAETGIHPRRLAIETVEFPFDLTLALAEELDVSLCFDTGHVLIGLSGPVDFFAALDQALPRIGQIHLHDAPAQVGDWRDADGKDHQPLGSGDLDLPRFLDRLTGAGFTGPVIFELPVDQAVAGLALIQSLRPGLVASG